MFQYLPRIRGVQGIDFLEKLVQAHGSNLDGRVDKNKFSGSTVRRVTAALRRDFVA